MTILVTGGAGYVGSHLLRALLSGGHAVVVVDDLSEGHRAAIPAGVPLVEGPFADVGVLGRAIEVAGPVDGVMHMAASCLVGESMTDPGRYYENNLAGTLRLIENQLKRGITKFVLSSTAAVYGDPLPEGREAIEEDHPCRPTNVYGETKLAAERALDWYARCAGLRAVSLRYFNAAGADPAAATGEDHAQETHLIPLVCAAALGRIPHVTVLGRDYPTPDGTCLRDYVHVNDLAAAHLLALKHLSAEGATRGLEVFNLGSERAVSVLEVIAVAGRLAGREVPFVDGPRRPGDPATLLASSARARGVLGWKPALSAIEDIVGTALAWHRSHPRGYRAVGAP